jgi:serine/threonine protein kinase
MNGIPNPGEHLDHFLIEKMVTRGGMATLLRATDTRTGAPVAIKIPHPELECDPLFFDRFQREADLGRKLDHPGVVKVLPQHDPSRVYMATEWIEGRPLRLILEQEGKFAPELAIRIALQICEAVGYIHSLGVVHRDLKPENIMLGPGDSVKLIDFGLAGEVAGRRLTFAHITKSMGTPDYISPEQVKGKRGDERSDVYAIGIMLYEMLTGQVPFRGPNPLVAMNQRLVCDPEPASHFDQAITPEMEEILWHALERDPRVRYPSARHLAIDLRAPQHVPIKDRVARDWETSRAPKPRAVLPLVLLGLIPVVIFVLLLFVAHQK